MQNTAFASYVPSRILPVWRTPSDSDKAPPHFVQNSANLGGQIFEGLLYKKGAIVKNWKFRWFLLSPTQREVSRDPAVYPATPQHTTPQHTTRHHATLPHPHHRTPQHTTPTPHHTTPTPQHTIPHPHPIWAYLFWD